MFRDEFVVSEKRIFEERWGFLFSSENFWDQVNDCRFWQRQHDLIYHVDIGLVESRPGCVIQSLAERKFGPLDTKSKTKNNGYIMNRLGPWPRS